MDVVWLILDSISFDATPFAPDGPATMPELAAFAEDHGVLFSNAYAPGPLSPSSSGTMFTGELPSVTGMHEAHPYLDHRLPTVASELGDTHETYLLTLNMWLTQGLDEDFDHVEDFTRQYLLFREATDPVEYFGKHGNDGWLLSRLARFALHQGKPLRSLMNYLSHALRDETLVPERWGDERNYQYAGRINDRVRNATVGGESDAFVVASYMDAHPPFDPTDESLERFAPGIPRSELPVNTYPERHVPNEEKSYDPSGMEMVYLASIWDLDRKVTPLIRDLVDDGAFVVVTSDHGIWDRDRAIDDSRLHVPLLLFAPGESSRRVDHTVNLRSLPRTTMEFVTGTAGPFSGANLFGVREDQVSVSEIIHHPNDVYRRTGRVNVTKTLKESRAIQRDLVLIKGDARVTYVDGSWRDDRGSDSARRRLRDVGASLLESDVEGEEFDEQDLDEVSRERLQDLGYITE